MIVLVMYLFFFSSRRRHTRLVGDWSSDVCSSDLNAQATAKTDSVCRPMVGENAMNTPTANARASLWGGSFRLNRDRMRSRIYLLFTWSSPFPPQNAQSFFPFRLETGRTGMGDIIPCLSGFPIK